MGTALNCLRQQQKHYTKLKSDHRKAPEKLTTTPFVLCFCFFIDKLSHTF